MKKVIRLTESDLHKIIKNSINSILKESKFRLEKDGSVYNDKGELVYSPKLPNNVYKRRYDNGNTPFGNKKNSL